LPIVFAGKRLFWAPALFGAFHFGHAWCHSYGGFLAVRALTGLGETLYFPAVMSLLSDTTARTRVSGALSWHQSAVYAGTILGSWMAAVLAEGTAGSSPLLFGRYGIRARGDSSSCFTEPKRDAVDTGQTAPGGHAPGSPSLPIRDTLG